MGQERILAYNTLAEETTLYRGDEVTFTFEMGSGGTLRPGRYALVYQRIDDGAESAAADAASVTDLLRGLEHAHEQGAPPRGLVARVKGRVE